MKMNEELEQLLKNLKLRRILDIHDEQLRAAEKEDVSYTEFMVRLLRAQWYARQETALEWRIRRANLPERWSLETFPFARQPGVNRKQIRTNSTNVVPLLAVENALVLAAARRLLRDPASPPLRTVRSLAYFLPVLDELLGLHVSQDYFCYLQNKIEPFRKRREVR